MEAVPLRLIIILLLTATLMLAASPQRIVSTAPSITETLFAMGLGPRVVAVTNYCNYPPEVLKLPKIGTYLKPDVEAIVALHPDLVVIQKQGNRLGEQLALVHIRSVDVQSDNLNAVYKGAREIGKATGETATAEHFVSAIQTGLKDVATRASQSHTQPSVLFLVGHTPGRLEDLIAGAGPSYFSDLLTVAGAKNAFADALSPYPHISLEEVLSRDPDFILELSGESRPSQQDVFSLWRTHGSLRAVKNHHVFGVTSAAFLVPGPRAPEAARIMLHLLHPELQP